MRSTTGALCIDCHLCSSCLPPCPHSAQCPHRRRIIVLRCIDMGSLDTELWIRIKKEANAEVRTRPGCFVNRSARCYLEVTSQNVVSRTIQTHIFTLEYDQSSSPLAERVAINELIAQEEKRLRRLNPRTNCVKSSKKSYSRSEHRSNQLWPTTNPSLHLSEP